MSSSAQKGRTSAPGDAEVQTRHKTFETLLERYDCDLLDRAAEVFELFAGHLLKFGKSLMLMRLPIRVVKVLMEHDDWTGHDAISESRHEKLKGTSSPRPLVSQSADECR